MSPYIESLIGTSTRTEIDDDNNSSHFTTLVLSLPRLNFLSLLGHSHMRTRRWSCPNLKDLVVSECPVLVLNTAIVPSLRTLDIRGCMVSKFSFMDM